MILSLIPDSIKLPAVFGAGIAIGGGATFYPAKWIGQSEGRQMAATAALSKSVQVLRERKTIDDEVSTSDAAALCADLGLSDSDKAECVRRILSPDAEPGNVGTILRTDRAFANQVAAHNKFGASQGCWR